jgi:hypothetical protein
MTGTITLQLARPLQPFEQWEPDPDHAAAITHAVNGTLIDEPGDIGR